MLCRIPWMPLSALAYPMPCVVYILAVYAAGLIAALQFIHSLE
jgi:hypothetical protein